MATVQMVRTAMWGAIGTIGNMIEHMKEKLKELPPGSCPEIEAEVVKCEKQQQDIIRRARRLETEGCLATVN